MIIQGNESGTRIYVDTQEILKSLANELGFDLNVDSVIEGRAYRYIGLSIDNEQTTIIRSLLTADMRKVETLEALCTIQQALGDKS